MSREVDSKKINIEKEEMTKSALRTFYHAKMKNFGNNLMKRGLTTGVPFGIGMVELPLAAATNQSSEYFIGAGLLTAAVLGSVEFIKFVQNNNDLVVKHHENAKLRKEEAEKLVVNRQSLKIFDSLKSYSNKLKMLFNVSYNAVCFACPVAMFAQKQITGPEVIIAAALVTTGTYFNYKVATTKSKMKRVIKDNPELNKEYQLEEIMNK